MKVTCTLGTLDKAIKAVEKYEKDLKTKQKVFLERLARLGVETSRIKFQQAIYAGHNDVSVQPYEWVGNDKIIISATGRSVTFIEFGAGIHYPEVHPKAAEFGYTKGGYGYHLGRMDSWRYKGDPGNNGYPDPDHPGYVKTHGNPPNRSMYDAAQEMRKNITKIAKEVFHD